MHLILFFDINGTIMIEDSKQGKDLELAVCQMPCRELFGIMG